MSEVASVSIEGGGTSDGFEMLASLNEGFLGTGFSTWTELSLIATALFIGYVAIGTVKYFRPEFSFLHALAGAVGLESR